MPSHYTVLQYMPNPLNGERMNVGVIAYDGTEAAARFLTNWRRAGQFGSESLRFVRRLADEVEELIDSASGDEEEYPRLEESLARMRQWDRVVRLTAPRASLLMPDDLIKSIANDFLLDPQMKPRARSKVKAAAFAARKVKEALVDRFATKRVRRLVKRRTTIKGKFDTHTLDVTVANGKPFYAAHAISFEVRDKKRLASEVNATLWLVDDLRQKDNDLLPLSVLAFPPKDVDELYAKAEEVVGELGAYFLAEDKFALWAQQMATQLPEDFLEG